MTATNICYNFVGFRCSSPLKHGDVPYYGDVSFWKHNPAKHASWHSGLQLTAFHENSDFKKHAINILAHDFGQCVMHT